MLTEPAQEADDLLDRLIARGFLDSKSAGRGQRLAQSEGIRIERALLRLGLIEEDALLAEIAQQAGIPFHADPAALAADPDVIATLTAEYLQANALVPITDTGGTLRIATADPLNPDLCAELAFLLDREPALAAAPVRVIRAVLAGAAGGPPPDAGALSQEQHAADREAFRQGDAEGPVIRFVAEKFDEAVALGASDLHFEIGEDGLRIRIRREGVLERQPVDHGLNPSAVLARLKVMAGMNVSERRLPQDGRITSVIAGRKVDFRVSSVPTSFGESIVARVLDPRALRLGWQKLGFEAGIVARLIEIVESPSGLFLVTGPTGSGKTTTLYTALSHLNTEGRKILTVEDPIEYNLPGIEQVQVHEAIGMTFARALRSFLRQDPNVIMVGEIRDRETAEIACRAALVGRMVLSTLHTATPEGAVTRLVDLGVPEYLVRDVLRGVLGQSLDVRPGRPRQLQARLAVV
ncbi:MAG: type II/IV secretion system protein [Rhodobacteraceae bacterium]|nr:type II/IV secretion system protein [Paracoccaceae bacterium]